MEDVSIKSICRTLSIITAIVGILGSLVLAYQFGVELDVGYYSSREERNWALTLVYFLAGIFVTSIWTAILYGMYEILERQENCEIRLAMLNDATSSMRENKHIEDILSEGGWKCPECGQVNASYVGTCKCGANK